VVQSLKLRAPLNSKLRSSQSWPLTDTKSAIAITFDFAAPTAPASLHAANSKSTGNRALRPSNLQDSALMSSLIGVRASAMLVISCGDFRKELSWIIASTGAAGCVCCSHSHSIDHSDIDAGFISMFPAVIAALFY